MPSPTPAPIRSRTLPARLRDRFGSTWTLVLVFIVAVVATLIVTFVLITMFERKQEARTPFVRVAEISEITTNPRPWGMNWPHQFDGWKSTAGDEFYGGSSALPQSKLDTQPYLRRLYAGYAFSIDYREARGHAYMLYDQGVTERITKKPQAGACLHCHSSITVLYRSVGMAAMGQPNDAEALAADFNMPAVIRGFEELSRQPYADVLAQLYAMPDGSVDDQGAVFPAPPEGGFTGEMHGQKLPEGHQLVGTAHPVTCIDCHDPAEHARPHHAPGFHARHRRSRRRRCARPAPAQHRALAARRPQSEPYDPNRDASRQEMRSFVCGSATSSTTARTR
jgi:nitrite reductase (cytochrome c-552)